MSRHSAAWAAVAEAARGVPTLAALFGADAGRTARLSVEAAGLHFDFSKTHLSPEVEAALAELLAASDFESARAALFSGAVVNPSEARAATHAAERGSGSGPAVAAAAEARAATRRLVARVETGAFGEIRHILHIGIGGSALGPALLVDALDGGRGRYDTHVISNIDGIALERAMRACDPARTLVVVVSKTFTTVETMTNAESARDWIGGAERFVAVTAAPERAADWGIAPENVLGFAESVGGRYSLWSAVGVTAALALGWTAFEALLAGGHAMDAHFESAPVTENAPVLAAMTDVLYAAFLGAETRAVFAYDERLRLLPPFLQQLEMESNGKRVDRDGKLLTHPSAAITWGGTGTDAQHAVFQLLHQGTHLVPIEFVMVKTPGHGLGAAHHRQLLANAVAQGAALMRGRSEAEALALSGGDAALAAAKTFPGNRPSSAIVLDTLDPHTLGALIAFYEHRTFTAAVLLGINPFDQWGVELGKEMARAALDGDAGADFDASSRALLARLL
ncbi:glucose-6-phosphate isomerase [Sphingosinicella microcystinivorans]|uniref:glucose-6-phosphate isomerase n=1 Tax=Sphingosinicella microcystinivorans TaxID=335406 RepID=UPI0022F3CD69|nr:glucose-6-phosphate isomerase [Sphingosinicella microcystinivorans]WBX83599.1 glucose-6-phosphate isomerase [Sphingosinicella microcystinivorans]